MEVRKHGMQTMGQNTDDTRTRICKQTLHMAQCKQSLMYSHREEVGIKLRRIEKMRRHMGSHFIKMTAAVLHDAHTLLIMQT